ncbi:MAG: hypothetical protein AB7G75_12305 [Candidatus Binatia bacterium]
MRRASSLLFAGLSVVLLTTFVFAEADGPDFYDVTGVRTGDVLNIRAKAQYRSTAGKLFCRQSTHHLVARLITVPLDIVHSANDLVLRNQEALAFTSMGVIQTAVHNMTPGTRFIRTLAAIPVVPGVATHSIIAAVKGDGPVETGSDGADMTATPYTLFGAHLPLGRCGPGDQQVLADLRPRVRLPWMATHRLPSHIRYFSLAAFTEQDRVARALFFPTHLLARVDPQNDGQLLARDMIIPGGSLLGYAHADHWAVANTIEDAFPFLAGRPGVQNKFPTDVLFEAMVLFVIEYLPNHFSDR